LPEGEEGWAHPFMESPLFTLNLTEANNNDKKLFKRVGLNSSIKRKADNFVTPTIAKKIKTGNTLTSGEDSNSSTENLLPPTDMCRRRSWRRNSSHTTDYFD
jgi:hypothetical protein